MNKVFVKFLVFKHFHGLVIQSNMLQMLKKILNLKFLKDLEVKNEEYKIYLTITVSSITVTSFLLRSVHLLVWIYCFLGAGGPINKILFPFAGLNAWRSYLNYLPKILRAQFISPFGKVFVFVFWYILEYNKDSYSFSKRVVSYSFS